MRQTPEKLKELYELLQNKIHLKSIVMTLAVLVVFVTTYVLILPAFTLDKEEAAEQGGIDVVAIEQQAESETEDAVVEEATESEAKEEAAESDNNKNVDAAETKTEKAESKDDKADTKLLTKKTELTADGKDFTVSATVDRQAKVPADTSLEVKELDENTEGFDYEKYKSEAFEALKKDDSGVEDIKIIKFYDISLESDTQDESVEPSDTVAVKIAYDKGIKVSDANNIRIVHFGEKKTEVLDTEATVNSKNQLTEASFETDGFSVYAVVEGSTDDYARMKLQFYNGDTLVETIYVKEGDTAEELELILHDPGAGTLASGEVFNGWILDNQDFTTADVGDAWTIAQVREWAESKEITDGEVHRLDAAICKLYTITYTDEDGTTVLGKDAIPVKSSEYMTAEVDCTVKMGYTPKDDIHNFEGWKIDDDTRSNVTSAIPSDGIYQNDDPITIKGDISFTVNAPVGNWLVFDENGKGGKYNAPQFVKSEGVTARPCVDDDMVRNGYTFGGWYDTKEHADAHGNDHQVTTGEFSFGHELRQKTTVYASWIPNETAPYTVILWGQKLNGDGTDVINEYEVLGSYSNENGVVGQNIPYTTVENQDEDYVTGVGNNNGHYTGFCLTEGSKNQQITITPEGDAVLNLYFDRIKYNFKFYLYRESGTGNSRYTYANNSGTGSTLNNLVTWHNPSNNHPSAPSYQDKTESHRFGDTNYTYHYFTISAYYGQDISSIWPTYDKIQGADNREAVSYVMMVGTKLKPNATSQGSGTVKGVITVMDDNILGATNNINGNYVIVRFPGSYYNWRYHIWLETVEGEDYSGYTTHTYEGKTYYEETVQTVRSSNIDEKNQNEPTYQGFDYVLRVGQNEQGVWQASSDISRNRTDEKGHKYGNYWRTDENGNYNDNGNYYHLNYVYNRQLYKISYFDGNYVDGRGNQIQNRASNPLHKSDEIAQGARIPEANQNYIPDPEELGFVFAGWYVDEACTVEYTWGTMPVGGIVVYAKWIQKQYRVFLHPNAGDDPNLSWGDDNVSTSFRVDYGGKVSTPTGTRQDSGYEFVGWYTDPSCDSKYLYKPDTALNDETVTTPYYQTEPTELDKWGNPLKDENGNYIDDEGNILVDDEGVANPNMDSLENRFWIDRQLNLYAKWRKILEGSSGINVVYTADDGKDHVGSNPPIDESLYPDQADATAQAACAAPEDMYFKYWVVQAWDSEQGIFVDTDTTVWPGQKFTVKEEDAYKEPVEGEQDTYQYTVQLRAEYAEPSSGLPTHIWWFNNYSDDGAARHYSAHQNEGIKINEAVDVVSAPTREGYIFLGWARVPTGTSESLPGEDDNPPTAKVLDLDEGDLYLKYEDGKFTLNDPSSEYNGREITQVAADERLDYHDMYAVWEAKKYNVDITKVVQGDSETKKFTINYSYDDVTGSVVLGNGEATSDISIGKTIGDIPYGTLITITEEPDDAYEPSFSATHKVTVTDDNGDEVVEDQAFDADESGTSTFEITSDTLITVTNTRKTQQVKIYKIDQITEDPLEDAQFTLNGQEYSTDSTGYTAIVELNVQSDPYVLAETKAPDGYNLPENSSSIIVNADKVEYKQGTAGQTVDAEYDSTTGVYIVTITNTPGKPLPHTGGIGSTIFYIIGSLLAVGCGLVLVSRRRMDVGK